MNRNQFQRTQEAVALAAVTSGQSLGYRNVITNGAMQVAQRATSVASITTSGYYTADRFQINVGTLGTWTQSVENDAPTGSGFRKSLKMTCTTADASPAAGDLLILETKVEGQNLQQFLKGTASAKAFTLTFWVKGSTTGTYISELRDHDNSRVVSASYTISAANTWEKKTLSFPADTTGAFDNDNALSLSVFWWLGAGTDYTSGTLNTTWASVTNANRAVGQTNLGGATSRSWQITGVQLEAGSVATPFEFEDYGTTLAKCRRYYTRFAGGSVYSNIAQGHAALTTAISITWNLPVAMRVEPTSIDVSSVAASDFINAVLVPSSVTIESGNSGPDVVHLVCAVTGATQFRPYVLGNNNNADGYVGVGAEL